MPVLRGEIAPDGDLIARFRARVAMIVTGGRVQRVGGVLEIAGAVFQHSLGQELGLAELAMHGPPATHRLHQPQLLEVGDVAQIPGQRAENGRVDAVQLLVVERLEQQKRAFARLRQATGDGLLGAGGPLGSDASTL